MRTRHDDMAGLIGEFSRSIPPFLSHDRARGWTEWLNRVASLMLRLKPEDVFWAIQAFEAEAEPWADGDDAACQPKSVSEVNWTEVYEALGHEPDEDRYDYMANIDWIPINTDIAVELAEDGNPAVGGGDIDCANEWARERDDDDLPDPFDPEIWEGKRVNESESGAGSGDDDPVPANERMETPIRRQILTATEGIVCTMPDQKDVPFSRVELRSNWVTMVGRRSTKRGGELRLMSVFPDGTENMSLDGYEKLVMHHFPLSGGFEQALWLEEHQHEFDWLMSLIGKVAIDFWGSDLQGRKNHRGIVRMKPSFGAWKAGIEWFSPPYAYRDDRISDRVRIAVFTGKA